MKCAIFGSGGVGGYFGARLAQSGHDVTFIARGAHLEAIRGSGLRLTSVSGDTTISPAHATDDPASVGIVDLVIVGVKAWQLPDAARGMKPLVGSETIVLPLENGVEAPGILAAELGREHVFGGLCAIVSMIEAPGHVRHAGIAPIIRFGELDNSRTERLAAVERVFSQAPGLSVEVPDDIEAAIWRKFVFIAAWSSVGSITRAPIGAIRSIAGTRRLLHDVLAEAVAVGRARGVRLADDIVDATMAFFDSVAPGSTASMQRDVMAGKPSELEAQTGAIVRFGEETGVATPVSEVIYHALLPMEAEARGNA